MYLNIIKKKVLYNSNLATINKVKAKIKHFILFILNLFINFIYY